ncbi:type IV pilus assembly protein PilM [Tissierella sp.]|uniref:type IV pilus assembly protein PilM n=1 Tax=Tissierella sp. TaxID=41274 RepID=UPI0028595DE9|nr:type IV pilus assembly protein PilM [Tissierella sp.]MDR7856125.1 type IV pilus assembly protein PilM [Tissierella sp.]
MKLPLISKKILSLDFGSHEIKVIEGRVLKGESNISKAFTIQLPKGAYLDGEIFNQTMISTTIKNALKDNKVSTDLAYGVINSSSIITREIVIPKVMEKEISSVINYQLNDYLPINLDDYVIKYIILGTSIEGNNEKLNILLIGILKKMVTEHLSLMKDAGLKPQILDFQGNAIAKLLQFNALINEQYNTRDVVIASVDIGYINSKLTVIRNGVIEVSRVIEVGAKELYENVGLIFDCSVEDCERKIFEVRNLNTIQEDFTDYYRLVNVIKSILNNLLEKIEIVFKYYISRGSKSDINYILLQGGLSNLNGVDNIFSNYFNIPSVKLISLDKIKFDGDLSQYSNAIGGLIRMDEVQK